MVIRDQDDAEVYAPSANVDMDGWKQYAMARMWGDADIYPGMCVEIVTTNRQYLKAKYDGKWLVRATSHQMDRQQYQTMLSLARPPSTDSAQTSTVTGPSGRSLGTPVADQTLTSTRLRLGRYHDAAAGCRRGPTRNVASIL